MSSATATTMSTAWPAPRRRSSAPSWTPIPTSMPNAGGRARLSIRGGRLAIGSVLAARGLGTALTPDWSAMADGPTEI